MKNLHRWFSMAVAFVLVLGVSLNAEATFWKKDKTDAEIQKEIQQERAEISKMAKETLSRLYKLEPSAKKSVSKSAGYAVFSNFGMKIFFAGGGSGKGIVFDNKTKKQTYMKMVEIQAGLGLGIKKFSVVWPPNSHPELMNSSTSLYFSNTQITLNFFTPKPSPACISTIFI